MTSQTNDQQTLTVERGVWVRFAMDAAERWLLNKGDRATDMERFAAYLRQMRYRSGLTIETLSEELGLPHHKIALLEQGMLRPSEVPGPAWVRLVRLVEGREQLAEQPVEADPQPEPEAEPQPELEPEMQTPEPGVDEREPEEAPAEPDPDEQWAMEEAGEEPAPAAPAAKNEAPKKKQPEHPKAAPSPTRPETAANFGIASIKVIGVGGGGTNAVSRMFRQRVPGIEYIGINTDAQHLQHLEVPVKIRVGDRITRGLGVGGNPELGREAALESREELQELIAGTDMVFLASGMGGGTGTGATPVIAEIAKEAGALTIAAVTKPFSFEGKRRVSQAEEGIARLRGKVDTLIIIPNDRLYAVSDENMTAEEAFRLADDVLRQGVQSIAELVTVPGEINLDFADVKTVMGGAGPAWMAIGHGHGKDRAVEAAKAAMASPLLDAPVEGATRVLLNITGGTDLTLQEVQRAADYVAKLVDPDANIIFGMVTDTRMNDEVRVTVIATGIEDGEDLLEQTIEDVLEEVDETEYQEVEERREPGVELPGFFRRLGFGRRRNR